MSSQTFEIGSPDPQRTEIRTIEDAILQHSHRGMTKLAEFLPADYCHEAAREILSWKRGTVVLTTGFFVNGFPETDGPAGTMVMAKALAKLGFSPVIVAEPFARAYFAECDVAVLCVQKSYRAQDYEELLDKINPVGLISIERCGRNSDGDYLNMRGKSVGNLTSSIDEMFLAAAGKIPTVGIGDGGNEIGMGALLGPIHATLSINPCIVPVDKPVVASVSNWGAYGLAGCLEELSGEFLLPNLDEVENFLNYTVSIGSVDGVSGENVPTVDGYELSTSREVYRSILKLADTAAQKLAATA